MTEHAQPRIWAGIDIPKTIAGTLAAVSAAVVGSFLGVAGTLAGAALISMISSIGTEIYHRSLDRGTKKLQAAFVAAPAAVGTPEVAAAARPAVPAGSPPEESTPRRIRWKRVVLVAGALFVLAMGTLTAAELLAGRSAADATSGRDSGAPTVFHWTDGDNRNPTPIPSGATTDSDQNSDEDSTPAGTTPATTSPADSPTEATQPAPQQTTGGPAEPEPTGGTDQGGGEQQQPENGPAGQPPQ